MTATTHTETVPARAYVGKHRGLPDVEWLGYGSYFGHYVGKHRKDDKYAGLGGLSKFLVEKGNW